MSCLDCDLCISDLCAVTVWAGERLILTRLHDQITVCIALKLGCEYV